MRADQAGAFGKWLAAVGDAAAGFEARWTMRTLDHVDRDLAQRLRRQRDLFDQMCVTGSRSEIEEHGGAMCRGYAAAIRAMEASGEAEDAFLRGQDTQTGLKVAVGIYRASARHVAADGTIWITPDEVATLVAASQAGRSLAAIKGAFPGSELQGVRQKAEAAE